MQSRGPLCSVVSQEMLKYVAKKDATPMFLDVLDMLSYPLLRHEKENMRARLSRWLRQRGVGCIVVCIKAMGSRLIYLMMCAWSLCHESSQFLLVSVLDPHEILHEFLVGRNSHVAEVRRILRARPKTTSSSSIPMDFRTSILACIPFHVCVCVCWLSSAVHCLSSAFCSLPSPACNSISAV
jgi:hypothetical protein